MKRLASIISCATLVAVAGLAFGAGVTVQVSDTAGTPIEGAAVFVEVTAGKAPPLRARSVEIEQKDRRFTRMLTIVQVGQPIAFPNNDTVRHHVYSLSQAKLFELKLYAGVPASPVVFDKPGVVVIGCNIHDKMVAYIRVVDTPWFGTTDAAGRVRLDGLPEGQYKLRAWHSDMTNMETVAEQALVLKGDLTPVAMLLNLKPGAR